MTRVAGRAHRSAGTILLPLIAGLMPGYPLIAWGKPVQTNPANYTPQIQHADRTRVGVGGGPGVDLLLAILDSIVFVAMGKAGVRVPVAQALVRYVLAVNLALMFFNLIPLGPLDGAAVLAGILPESAQPSRRRCGATAWGFCSCCCSPAR